MANNAWWDPRPQWGFLWSPWKWVPWPAEAGIASVVQLLLGLLSEALSQPIFGQPGYPEKWEQFSLQVFARVWPNMKNDLYNFITLWWMFLHKNIPRKQNCQAQKQSRWIFWPLSAPTFPLCSWKWLERVLYPFTFQYWDLESFSPVS